MQWHKEKSLIINEDFQRRAVWVESAKSYFIETVLRQLPIPLMYMRTKIDPRTQKAYREIVDGQQRLRTFAEFASNRLRLNKRAGEFSGLCYGDLNPEVQGDFLAYPITVIQLINASDDDVIDIFGRLNAYNVVLNAAEQRHAKYQGDFKWAVHAAALRWSVLWDKYRIISVRQRVRMFDDSLMSEMFGILLQGVTDGGERNIEELYKKCEKDPWDQEKFIADLDLVLRFAVDHIGDAISGNLARPPHFLMLFAALAHALVGIPMGKMGDMLPERREGEVLSDIGIVLSNFDELETVIGADEPEKGFKEFWLASAGTTHRIASRKVRFPVYYRALLPRPL